MLCLSRRINEQIVIGDNIVITIVSTDRGKVRIGIEAPADVSVLRRELWLADQARDHREENAA